MHVVNRRHVTQGRGGGGGGQVGGAKHPKKEEGGGGEGGNHGGGGGGGGKQHTFPTPSSLISCLLFVLSHPRNTKKTTN
jgi:hypothetical protein